MWMNGIVSTNFNFFEHQEVYHGKVRDVYTSGNILVMVATDRISAFDHILTEPIPFKGQVLNQVAAFFLNATRDLVPNWMIGQPDPNVMIGYKCQPFKVEMVVRGFLAGHAWREYKAGKRIICGEVLPDGLIEGDKLPHPIITPTTKAVIGHDEDISRPEIISSGLVEEKYYAQMEAYSLALYQRGYAMALEKGLILVDTKYEFGLLSGQVTLMDEVHTPDSSRYYYLDGYASRQREGEKQKQLSKEFVREWLMEHGFQGKLGEIMPVMPKEFIREVSQRYIELYEIMTGEIFIPQDYHRTEERIRSNVTKFLAGL